jgi:Holliday junction resolvase RusA-like endonuclease
VAKPAGERAAARPAPQVAAPLARRAGLVDGGRGERRDRYLQPDDKAAQEAIAWSAAAAGVPRLGKTRVAVELQIPWGTPGDVDNRAKTLLDALQRGRIIDNDEQVDDLRPWRMPWFTGWLVLIQELDYAS